MNCYLILLVLCMAVCHCEQPAAFEYSVTNQTTHSVNNHGDKVKDFYMLIVNGSTDDTILQFALASFPYFGALRNETIIRNCQSLRELFEMNNVTEEFIENYTPQQSPLPPYIHTGFFYEFQTIPDKIRLDEAFLNILLQFKFQRRHLFEKEPLDRFSNFIEMKSLLFAARLLMMLVVMVVCVLICVVIKQSQFGANAKYNPESDIFLKSLDVKLI